jgi:hypothetical protein
MAKPGNATPGEGKEIPEGWAVFPRMGLGMEYGGFIFHDDTFTSMLRRRLEMDVLQYRRFIVYLEFDEETSFGTPKDSGDFNRMRFRLHLGGLRYDLGDHYVGLFYNHWCSNTLLTENYQTRLDRSQISIYILTLEFLSKTMRLGMKDRGIIFDPKKPFEFLWRFHYYASAGKVVEQSKFYDLEWILRAQVRLDLFRYYRLIPYLEAGGELWIGPTARVSPWVEWGIRYHVRDRLDLTPFFQWGQNQEIFKEGNPPIRRVAQNYLYAGMRLEYLFDSSTGGGAPADGLQFLPEIHGSATYLRCLKSRFFGWGGGIDLDLELLRLKPWTLFFYTEMRLATEKLSLGPDKIIGRLQYGLNYTREPYFAEAFVDQRKRMDVIAFDGLSEQSSLAGLRLGTVGMKPGHYNEGISFAGPKSFQWLNKLNAQASFGHFFQSQDWYYLWGLSTQARWDILRWYFIVPYVQGELEWLAGGGKSNDAVDYAAEAGFRFHGVCDLNVYFRFQHRDNAKAFQGLSDNQNIIGIKALF